MQINRRHFVGAALACFAGASTPSALAMSRRQPKVVLPARPKVAEKPALLTKALAALDSHGPRIVNRSAVGLVDFSEHSSVERFSVVDVLNGRVSRTYLVAHGRGSDPSHTGWLTSFSNRPGSNATSQGSFLVANTYYGKYGRSRRLIGLDPENDNALDRAIVIHGAPYVQRGLIDAQGRIGRSLGCFSFTEDAIDDVLDRLEEGSLLFASR